MDYSIIIYCSLAILGVLSCGILKWCRVSKKGVIRMSHYAVFFLMSIVIGGRYYVGADWANYASIFNYPEIFNLSFDNLFNNTIEPLYILLNVFLNQIGFSQSMFFTLVAFLMFVLLYESVIDKKKFPLILFFFYMILFGSSLNIIRQVLSIFIFFFVIRYIGKNIFKYSAGILTAFLIHFSSVIYFPLYFIYLRVFSFLENKKLILCSYLITWSIPGILNSLINTVASQFISNTKYLNSLQNLQTEMSVSSGLGILANHIIDLLIILCSSKILNKDDKQIRIIYRLFVVGVLFSNMFSLSEYLARLTLGLVSLKIFLLASMIYQASKEKNAVYSLLCCILILLYFAMFVSSIINNDNQIVPYQFYWI